MEFNFKKWNNLLGWGMFVIASIVYLMTMERHLSFWDCGEYIVSSAKLGVTHAPGAALFQLIGAVWAGLAFGDISKYAIVINSMSAICSALTILFLFWTITHFVRRMFFHSNFGEKEENVFSASLTQTQTIIVLGSGLIGASAFMFSDTFWFSAVEGEVYAMASLFTAILLWLGCKWEEDYGERSDKWLILISLVIGLSIGVHLMAILAFPAVCYLYYVKNYKITLKSFVIANLITIIALAFVFKFIFPFVMKFYGKAEVFIVNELGMPFHSGTFVVTIIIALFFWALLFYTKKYKFKLINTLTLSVLFMLIGFSCWLVIPIRANANPHMNLNDPDTALGMLDYFNREQYGDWPTFYGYSYVAHIAEDGKKISPSGNYESKVVGYNYVKNTDARRYDMVSERRDYVYNPKYVKFFPKMFSPMPDVMENYASMYGFPEFSLNTSFFNNLRDDQSTREQKKEYAQFVYSKLIEKKNNHSITISDLQKNAELLNIEPPSFWQEMNYFLDFQVGYMGVRYFMWNFSGKQNDWEGNLEVTKGNWISGIPFIDNWRLGNQSDLPAIYKENKGHNVYFMLPLLLGLLGFFAQLNRNFGHWWALLSLFLLTSVGILFYTSVKPFEPRERDYALVSAFYAFSIWIGIGVQAIYLLVKKLAKRDLSPKVAFVIPAVCLFIPILMGFQNWDDHDRSKRAAAYSLAYNYLKDLDENSILFVYGDNDTYPLWGLQETEEFRDDIKIVNYTLLGAPWYMEQVQRKTYNANALPGQMQYSDYQLNTNDNVLVVANRIKSVFGELKDVLKPNSELSIYQIMELPVSEIQNHLTDSRYDANMIKQLYQEVAPFREYAEKESMTAKEAIEFILDNKNPAKQAIANFVGISALKQINILPVNKIRIPVNKENAIKFGIVSEKEAEQMVDEIVITLGSSELYKNDLMMIDMFANYDWSRPIYFSGGGVLNPSNVFYLNDYLQYNGLSYKLVPIYTQFGKDGVVGRSDTEELYKSFNNYLWGNYADPKASFANTDRNYTNAYRNIAYRLADDLINENQKDKAKKVLDKIMKEIPMQPRYDYSVGLSRIASLYQKLGEVKTAEEIFEHNKNAIMGRINYFESLPYNLKFTIFSDLSDAINDFYAYVYMNPNPLNEADKEFAMNLFNQRYLPKKEELIKTMEIYKMEGIREPEKQQLDKLLESIMEQLSILRRIDSAKAKIESDELTRMFYGDKQEEESEFFDEELIIEVPAEKELMLTE